MCIRDSTCTVESTTSVVSCTGTLAGFGSGSIFVFGKRVLIRLTSMLASDGGRFGIFVLLEGVLTLGL